MPDAVLIEWENVLAETASARRDALVGALAAEGVTLGDRDWTERCAHLAPGDAVRAALAGAGVVDAALADLVALRASRAFSERMAHGFVLRRGAREFMERLQLDSRVAIVTSASRSETDFVLRLAGLDDAVSVVVTADDVATPPPHPDAYLRALSQLGRRRLVQREQGIALAATAAALRAARAAGVRTLAVGAPAHIALEADAVASEVDGLVAASLARMTGTMPSGRSA
ncbi:MAG: HAD family phosphatase [bacterium]